MWDRDCRRYLSHVRRGLRELGSNKKVVLQQVKASVAGYAAENPQCSYQELIQRFGTPRQIAESYVNEMGSQEVLHTIHKRRKQLIAVVTAVVLALIVWVGHIAAEYSNHLQRVNGYAVVTVVPETSATE